MSVHQIFYGTGILLSGLLAGLFYGFQCSVINGLGALANKEYLLGFQSINSEIQNPVFFLCFIGNMIILPVAAYLFYKIGSTGISTFLIIASVIYTIGVFGITVICNVPLNERLAGFDIHAASGSQLNEMRIQFEASWNKWHQIRTIASIAVLITSIIPLVKKI